MKWQAIVGAGLLGVGTAAAQEFVAPQGPRDVPVVPAPTIEPPVTTEGIVAKVFNVDRPWQLINPLAPARYGTGATNRTVAPKENDPGKPDGFILFGIEFW